MSEFIMLFYFVILYSYLHIVPGFRKPCMVKWSVISKWVFPQMIFLFLLRYLLTSINICISIIGKVVLISLNKCEAQTKVRVYWFIGMTIWKEYGWIFQIVQVIRLHVQNTVFRVSDVLRKCENQTLSCINLGTRKEELEWMLYESLFYLVKGSSSLKALTWTNYTVQSARIQTLMRHVFPFHCSLINAFTVLVTSCSFPPALVSHLAFPI